MDESEFSADCKTELGKAIAARVKVLRFMRSEHGWMVCHAVDASGASPAKSAC